jgi:hypothetical protein
MEKMVQKGVIDCPSCGKKWDVNKHNSCECGATTISSIARKGAAKPKINWVPAGDIYTPEQYPERYTL